AFGHYRVRLAGDIADAEDPVPRAHADPRPDRTGGEHGSLERRTRERVVYAGDIRDDVLQHRIAGAPRHPAAQLLEPVAPHAAGQAPPAAVAGDHAAIAAGEHEQRHQVRRQPGAMEMRLEAEEIAGPGIAPARMAGKGAVLPRAVRGHDDAGS